MGVFLRWGVFGILAVAAMLYAYNASKRMAENRQAGPPAAAEASVDQSEESEPEPESAPAEEPEQASAPIPHDEIFPPRCDVELFLAERAMQARRDDEPLHRLLRVQEIAFVEDPALRKRLEDVAIRWYQYDGEPPSELALSVAVISDCKRFNPAP